MKYIVEVTIKTDINEELIGLDKNLILRDDNDNLVDYLEEDSHDLNENEAVEFDWEREIEFDSLQEAQAYFDQIDLEITMVELISEDQALLNKIC
jgi:hypothetical protein